MGAVGLAEPGITFIVASGATPRSSQPQNSDVRGIRCTTFSSTCPKAFWIPNFIVDCNDERFCALSETSMGPAEQRTGTSKTVRVCVSMSLALTCSNQIILQTSNLRGEFAVNSPRYTAVWG